MSNIESSWRDWAALCPFPLQGPIKDILELTYKNGYLHGLVSSTEVSDMAALDAMVRNTAAHVHAVGTVARASIRKPK